MTTKNIPNKHNNVLIIVKKNNNNKKENEKKSREKKNKSKIQFRRKDLWLKLSITWIHLTISKAQKKNLILNRFVNLYYNQPSNTQLKNATTNVSVFFSFLVPLLFSTAWWFLWNMHILILLFFLFFSFNISIV